MKWTPEAKTILEDYFAERLKTENLGGADREEVKENLEAHITEELAGTGTGLVTAEALRGVLSGLGDLEPVPPDGETDRSATLPWEKPKRQAKPEPTWKKGVPIVRKTIFWMFGVILPIGTLLIEWVTGFCAGTFFDPIPGFVYVLLVALVPLSSAWIYFVLKREDASWLSVAAPLSGAAILVGTYYAILFLPLLPMAIPGILFGIGILPLAAPCALLAAIVCWWRLMMLGAHTGKVKTVVWGAVLGAVVAVLGLASLEGPRAATRYGLMMAESEDEDRRLAAYSLMRSMGSEDTLLRACYEGSRGMQRATDTVGWVFGMFPRVSKSTAREAYYRVTGSSFNSTKPPSQVPRSRRAEMNDWTWDEDMGGDAVASRVSGLSMITSRIDPHIDPLSALSYMEWTIAFKNVNPQQREARFQVLLPPNGVVSRLTLWIDGEPREAAFGGRSQVKAAYKKVVVVEQRDPVMVNTIGPDRVLVQCFPVPPGGGEMKLRMGITCPVEEVGETDGRLWLPKIIERNFSFSPELRHAVWVQSPNELTSPLEGVAGTDANSLGGAFRAVLRNSDLLTTKAHVICKDVSRDALVWARDPFTEDGNKILVRERSADPTLPVEEVVLVVDASRGMSEHQDAIASALRALPDKLRLKLVFAEDVPREVVNGVTPGSAGDAVAAAKMHGGMDAVPALLRAYSVADHSKKSAIIWLHSGQSEMLSSEEFVSQFLDRSQNKVPIYSFQLEPGPDRVLEKLHRHAGLRAGGRLDDVVVDLPAFIGKLTSGTATPQHTWKRVAEEGNTHDEDAMVDDQLARYWAYNDVMGYFHSHGHDASVERANLAARYQIVTPYSGAVVLESQRQYDEAGLKPIDASTAPSVPSIPEPSSALLMLVGATALLLRRRR